eukprot:5105881-Prymnesium_polylepis.1
MDGRVWMAAYGWPRERTQRDRSLNARRAQQLLQASKVDAVKSGRRQDPRAGEHAYRDVAKADSLVQRRDPIAVGLVWVKIGVAQQRACQLWRCRGSETVAVGARGFGRAVALGRVQNAAAARSGQDAAAACACRWPACAARSSAVAPVASASFTSAAL